MSTHFYLLGSIFRKFSRGSGSYPLETIKKKTLECWNKKKTPPVQILYIITVHCIIYWNILNNVKTNAFIYISLSVFAMLYMPSTFNNFLHRNPSYLWQKSFAVQYILIYDAVCLYVWGCVWVCMGVCVYILVYTNGIYSVYINESYILGTTVKQKHTSMKLYI